MSDIENTFKTRIKDVDSLLSSYRELYAIYSTVIESTGVSQNASKAFQRAKDSADEKQRDISKGLYKQAFILLTGAAEALLKDIFTDLIKENFITIKNANKISFSAQGLQQVIMKSIGRDDPVESMSVELGQSLIEKVFNEKNPTEKINFQNVETMKQVFDQYFGIKIPESQSLKNIHRYWQMRHCFIHNDSQIDRRFIHNVKIVDLLKKSDSEGARLSITKTEYNKAKADFLEMFRIMEVLIMEAALSTRFISA